MRGGQRAHVARRDLAGVCFPPTALSGSARQACQGRGPIGQRLDHAEPRHSSIRPRRHCQLPIAGILAAFFTVLRGVTVLDPTCGSGAFLFAALSILEPLYAACLDRMQQFLAAVNSESATRGVGNDNRPPPTDAQTRCLCEFREILKSAGSHPNREYFIRKSIILQNLFGVDLMEEAVEICKLRLFLKLVAQVAPDPAKENLGLETLPDIDFNIRAGNALIGYTTLAEICRRRQAGTRGEGPRLHKRKSTISSGRPSTSSGNSISSASNNPLLNRRRNPVRPRRRSPQRWEDWHRSSTAIWPASTGSMPATPRWPMNSRNGATTIAPSTGASSSTASWPRAASR